MYCGIDISKNKSQICILDKEKKVVAEFVIEHNAEGFAQLETYLTTEMRIGMEPTSNYCKALHFFLKEKYDVCYIDTGQMRSFANLHSFKVKNDKIDARLIALYLAYNFKTVQILRTDDLKDLARLYHKTLKQLVRHKYMFQSQLGVIFPELEQQFHTRRTKGLANLLLEHPTPKEIAKLSPEQILHLLTKHLKRGKIFTLERAKYLHELAKKSIGVKDAPTACLKHTIRIMLYFQELVDQVKKEMGVCLAQSPYGKLLNEFGYNTTSLSIIVAEVGDIRRFANYKKFVRYCGFAVSEKQSGSTKSVNCFITKRGNRHLRSIFYDLAMVNIAHKTKLGDFYYRLKQNGKHAKTCIIATARKTAVKLYFDMLHCHTEEQEINSKTLSEPNVTSASDATKDSLNRETVFGDSSEPKSY